MGRRDDVAVGGTCTYSNDNVRVQRVRQKLGAVGGRTHQAPNLFLDRIVSPQAETTSPRVTTCYRTMPNDEVWQVWPSICA